MTDHAMVRPWFLYVLECRDGSLYTGITVDIEKRFQAHQCGRGARYTRSHPPLRIVAVQAHADRASALRAEYAVKQLPLEKKRAFCQAHAYHPG